MTFSYDYTNNTDNYVLTQFYDTAFGSAVHDVISTVTVIGNYLVMTPRNHKEVCQRGDVYLLTNHKVLDYDTSMYYRGYNFDLFGSCDISLANTFSGSILDFWTDFDFSTSFETVCSASLTVIDNAFYAVAPDVPYIACWFIISLCIGFLGKLLFGK